MGVPARGWSSGSGSRDAPTAAASAAASPLVREVRRAPADAIAATPAMAGLPNRSTTWATWVNPGDTRGGVGRGRLSCLRGRDAAAVRLRLRAGRRPLHRLRVDARLSRRRGAMARYVVEPLGPFSLEEARSFLAGFGPAGHAAEPGAGHLHVAVVPDGSDVAGGACVRAGDG